MDETRLRHTHSLLTDSLKTPPVQEDDTKLLQMMNIPISSGDDSSLIEPSVPLGCDQLWETDQAVMLGIDREELIRLRVSFIFNEPGIVLEYAFARGLTAGISHTMQLESYENVGMDPSKLTLHVLKDRYCRARLLPMPALQNVERGEPKYVVSAFSTSSRRFFLLDNELDPRKSQ
ncbi:hypothetical protein OESDEN_04309 [Oesophagostomum dentatum]|uniref:Uncharacterized protein n=1 Tax=Oesophagostomum dentatum TaxID=61180 RepID=A0A0B1TK10_OESDE|nr:hypothetical protein OESDEN_04309 [Oesophagostomum dentatum]